MTIKSLFPLLVSLLSFPCFAIGNTGTDLSRKAADICFIENKGQVVDQNHEPRNDIDFKLCATGQLTIFVGAGAIHYQYAVPAQAKVKSESMRYSSYRMDVQLIGANKNAKIIKGEALAYHEQYYTADAVGVYANSYNNVRYIDIYPGIDWVLFMSEGKLKHEFIIKEGGDATNIRLKYAGATGLTINRAGDLIATTPMGTITEAAPISYTKQGVVNSQYVLQGDLVTYKLANFSGKLIIDPALNWGTYYGDIASDEGEGIAVDTFGNSFIAGKTYSSNNIATQFAHQQSYSAKADLFIVKFNKAGDRKWGTFYGGTNDEADAKLSTDIFGNVYMVASTNSTGLATGSPYKDTPPGAIDILLVKFNASGIRQWANYYGGTDQEFAKGIAVDNSGAAVYITGETSSQTGIATSNGWEKTSNGTCSFLAKFNANGSIAWGTYVGGNIGGIPVVNDIATDAADGVYIVGTVDTSVGFATNGAHQSTYGGGLKDAFIAKYVNSGSLSWSSYYGGTSEDHGNGIAIDRNNNSVYITGSTGSNGAIATNGTFQPNYTANHDAFLVKLNSNGVRQWATYLGGASGDEGLRLAVDDRSLVYIAGMTSSTSGISTNSGISTSGGLRFAIKGLDDIFLKKFTQDGLQVWGAYFGGSNSDEINGLCCQGDHIYLGGSAYSTTDIAANGHQSIQGGLNDAFLVQFCDIPYPGIITGPTEVCEGNSVLLTSTIPGGQWYNGALIVTNIGTSGYIKSISATQGHFIYNLTNTCGTSHLVYDVQILPRVSTKLQPADTSVPEGADVTFSVDNKSSYTYQWQEDSGNGFKDLKYTGKYAGVNTNSLFIGGVSMAESNRKYRVIIANPDCDTVSQTAALSVWPLAVRDVSKTDFSVYPNPVQSSVTITAAETITRVEVMSLVGQKMFAANTDTNKFVVDMQSYPKGMYVIRINGKQMSRVVKE